MSLNTLTISDARDALRKGDVTSVEITEACLTAIEGAGALNVFVHNTPEMAREVAADLEANGETAWRIGEVIDGPRGCTVRGAAETWSAREPWEARHLA